MKIKGIINYANTILFRKKGILLLGIAMTTLCMCILNYSFIRYYSLNRDIISVKKNIDTDLKKTYKVTYGSIGVMSEENGKRMLDFVSKLSQTDGVDLCGKYYIQSTSLKNIQSKDEAGVYVDGYFVDDRLQGLKDIHNSDGNIICLTRGSYTNVAVGYNLKDIMPIGSTWEDSYYGTQYIVTDVIKQGETCISTGVIAENQEAVCLDDMILTLCDNTSFEKDGYFTCHTFANNVFFTIKDYDMASEICSAVQNMALKLQCPVVVQNMKDYIRDYKASYKDFYREIDFQTIMLILMSFVGLYITMRIDMHIQEKDIKTMYIFGVNAREHCIIHLFEQLGMLIPSFLLSYVLTFNYSMGKKYPGDIEGVFPYTCLVILLMVTLIQLSAFSIIKAYVIRRD